MLGGLFLVAIGAGVLAVAWQGYLKGELPAGANFLRGTYRPSRDDNPVAFHCFLVLYLCAGVVLAAWGLLMLIGMAEPLKLG